MTTLFGPHLLVRPSEPSVHGGDTRGHTRGSGATLLDRLTEWQPPVCVLLLPGLELQLLRLIQDPSVPVSELARITSPHQETYDSHCNATDLRYYIQPFQDNANLRAHTKLIGRIFIRDIDTDRHLQEDPQSPEMTAQFHHNLVMMARQEVQKPILGAHGQILQGAYPDLADRIDCWVIANEPQLDAEVPSERLTRLAQYEKARVRLANHTYNCGLFAFSTAQPAQKLTHWQQPAVQEALDAANSQNRDHGTHHLVLIHQYFKPDNAEDARNADHSFHTQTGDWVQGTTLTEANRRQFVQRFEHYIYPWFRTTYPSLKVIVSEYGADGRIGLDPERYAPNACPSAGWKAFPAWHNAYLSTLRQLEVYSRPYSDVILGYCLFAVGEYYDSQTSAGEFWTYRLDAGPGEGTKGEASILEDLISHARGWHSSPPGTMDQPGASEWLAGPANIPAENHHLYYDLRSHASGTVSCTLASSRSPVKSYARSSTLLLTVPVGFRPDGAMAQSVTGTWVDASGAPKMGSPGMSFTLELGKNGEVRYGNASPLPPEVDFLSFHAQLEWRLPASALADPVLSQGTPLAQLLPGAGRVFASVKVGAPGTLELQPGNTYVPVGWHDPRRALLNPQSPDLQILLACVPPLGTTGHTTGPDPVGWVPGSNLELQGNWRDLPTIPLLRVSAWVTAGANVRPGPGTEYDPPLRSLPHDGVWYPVVGKNMEPPGWWWMELSAGDYGWIHCSLVDLKGTETVPVFEPTE